MTCVLKHRVPIGQLQNGILFSLSFTFANCALLLNGKWPNVSNFNDKYKGTVARPFSPSIKRNVSSSQSKLNSVLLVRLMENVIKNFVAPSKEN